jgi:hypothetical protein
MRRILRFMRSFQMEMTYLVIPGRAAWRGSGIHTPGRGVLVLNETPGVWIPGSCFARPGMTEYLMPLNPQLRVRIPAAQRARAVLAFFAPKTKGVGNAGCPLHPQPRVQSVSGTRV